MLQKKTARKEIAAIIGISQATLSREIKRNSTPSGKYIWTKAHDMAMQHRRRTSGNSKLSGGLEFAAHKDITKWSDVPVYFADSYCSWQKGAVENTNKLIRQYILKNDSFENYTDKRIMAIQKKLNERSREN